MSHKHILKDKNIFERKLDWLFILRKMDMQSKLGFKIYFYIYSEYLIPLKNW